MKARIRLTASLSTICNAALRVVLSILMLLVIRCGSDGIKGPPKTNIRFWNGFTGYDGRTMVRLVKQFTAENKDINVRMQRMD